MTTIKLEIPETNAAALYHFGEALRNVAIAEGFIAPSNNRDTVMKGPFNVNEFTSHEPVTQAERDELLCRGDKSERESVRQVKKGNLMEYDYVERDELVKSTTPSDIDKTFAESGYKFGARPEHVDDIEPITPPEAEFTEKQAIDHIGNANDNPMGDIEPANDLPWDQRIHSRGKTRLADDTWRYARKPADKTKEEWDLYVEEVETELKALMSIPVVEAPVVEAPVVEAPVVEAPVVEAPVVEAPVVEAPVVEAPVVEAPVVEAPVVEAPVVEAPVVEAPVVEAPVVEAPVVEAPVVEAPSTGPTTFGELMRFITANGKKLNNDIVKEVLAANGLASIALLAARVDLIPQIHQALLGKL